MRLLERVDAWLFAAEDARRLAAMRIGLCLLLALRLATTDYAHVAQQQASLFRPAPLSYMRLFTHMPSHEVAIALQAVAIVATLLAAAGLVFRLALSLAIACSLLLNGILDSTGRVIVGDALLTLCLLVLLASGSAAVEAWSLRRNVPAARGPRYGWAVRTAMAVIALAYFLAAWQKWRHSGLAWVTSDNLRWILYAASDGSRHPNSLALFIADRPLLAHAFAAGSLLLETVFPLVLFVPRLRWVLVPGAIAMHIGIRLAMGLDYSAQFLAVAIVFVNWPVVVAWLQRALTDAPLPREASSG